MKVKRESLCLYAITDRAWLKGDTLAHQVELAIQGGVTFVQLREKQKTGEELKALALEVQSVCRRYQIPFIINDDVELAREIDADGVHVGQADMAVEQARRILGPDKIIGATAKTVEQAQTAQAQGADYLGSGAVFGSTTKKDAIGMDKALLQQICESVNIPVVAIGGINAENILQLEGASIAGVAVVSGIFAAQDIAAASAELLAKSKILTKQKYGEQE